jgi:hypothetical protein
MARGKAAGPHPEKSSLRCDFSTLPQGEGETDVVMLPFLWILCSMGVAYAAKVQGREPWFWFLVSLLISPLGGSIVLWAFNRYAIHWTR